MPAVFGRSVFEFEPGLQKIGVRRDDNTPQVVCEVYIVRKATYQEWVDFVKAESLDVNDLRDLPDHYYYMGLVD